LLNWLTQYDARLLSAQRRDVNRLKQEKDAFSQFLDAVESISKSDAPLLLVKSARNEMGGLINDIYWIEVAGWQAFYYADPIQRICIGLVVCKSDLSFDERVQLVANALRRNR
jgi:hypothetical protein